MLFNEHKEALGIVDGEVLFFTGAFIVNEASRVIGAITAVKQADGFIRTTVRYHHQKETPQVKTLKVLDPVEFEKYLNSLALQIGTKIPGGKLVETHYRTRTLDDAFTAHLESQEKEYVHQMYMLRMIKGMKRSEAYEHINNVIRKVVAQRV